jgi:RNA 3'-terminal phosphate cyclase (ATP)
LEPRFRQVKIKTIELPSPGKGTFLSLLAEFEHSQCCYFSLGELGKRAERVADEAVDALEAFLITDGVIDFYLADQLLLPLAFAKGTSRLRTPQITPHLLTNAAIIQRFLPVHIEIEGQVGQAGVVTIGSQK